MIKKILVIMALFISLVFGAVDLNTASKKELMSVSGIGAKKADAIIEYRNKTPFKSIDELKNIKGIGDKLFNKIKNDIVVNGTTNTPTTKATKIESNTKDIKSKDSKKAKDSKKDSKKIESK